ncbi:MAG: DUF4625 domain-containing protein [Flavobacteriales bacterium]|nr:DUF4625 domain-containing protein [Flavobacteriales bacterium]
MKNLIHYLLSIITVLYTISCGSGDGLKPDVEVSVPVPNTRYWVGSQILIDAILTNNSIIDQYKIELKLAPPCEPLDSAIVNSSWHVFANNSYLYVSPPAYNGTTIQGEIEIPNNFTPGKYHLIVSALNNQFNEGKDTVPIMICNQLDTIIPDIILISPTDGASIAKGDTLKIIGSVNEIISDLSAGSMHRIKITLVPQFSGFNSIEIYNSTTSVVTQINQEYFIGSSMPAGNYILRLVGIDAFNNFKQINIGLSITD